MTDDLPPEPYAFVGEPAHHHLEDTTMKTPLIFGREPAVVASLIEAALALLVSFGALAGIGIAGQPELALVMAVVSGGLGIYVAVVTSEPLLGVVTGMIKALLALAAVYGLTLSIEQTGALLAFTTVAIGLFQRTQVTPTPTPAVTAGQRGASDAQTAFSAAVVLTAVVVLIGLSVAGVFDL